MSFIEKLMGISDADHPKQVIKPRLFIINLMGHKRMWFHAGNSAELNDIAKKYCEKFDRLQRSVEFERFKRNLGRYSRGLQTNDINQPIQG